MTQTTKNINNRPSRRRHRISPVKVVIVMFVLLIIVIAATLAFLNRDNISSIFSAKTETQTSSGEKSEDEKDNNASDDKKEEEKDEKPDSPVRETEKPSNAQYEGVNANSYDTITGIINTSVGGDGSINIRVIIDQMLSSGNCTIVVYQSSGASNFVDAPIETGPSSSICVATIGAQSGHLTITADVSADGKKGTINGEANI